MFQHDPDDEAQNDLIPMALDGLEFMVPGPIEGRLVVIVPPDAMGPEAEALSNTVASMTGQRPLVISSNVKLARMRELSPSEVEKIAALANAGEE